MHHPYEPQRNIDAYEPDPNAGYEDWCGVVLMIGDEEGDPGEIQLTTVEAEEARAALDHELRLRHGPNIMDALWDDIMALYAKIMEGDKSDASRYRLEGMAWAMATMLNPGEPSLDAVREMAAERYAESA